MTSSRVLIVRWLGRWFALAMLIAPAVFSRAAAQRPVEARHAATRNPSVRIVGSFTELRIRGWDKDSIVLTGTIPAGAKFGGGFGGRPGGMSAGAKWYLENPSGEAAGKLELRVPEGARVWAKSGSADIDASGMTGGLDLNIVGGSVHVSGTPHELNVESMDGRVTIDGKPAWLRVKTATGDITVMGGSEDAGLTTVSGTIRVAAGTYERLRVESVTGSAIFGGDLAHGASLDVNTHSGAIELRVPRKLDADYDIATVAGSIENRLTSRPAVPGREGRGQEIGFTTGNGGARVYVRSFKGSILLLAR